MEILLTRTKKKRWRREEEDFEAAIAKIINWMMWLLLCLVFVGFSQGNFCTGQGRVTTSLNNIRFDEGS
jgi:hypothetical protein